MAHEKAVPDVAMRVPQAALSGEPGMAFSWVEQFSRAPRGFMVPPGPFPLPAIGSPDFYLGQELRVHAGGQVVPIIVRDTTNYFPTVNPSAKRFLLVNLDDYQDYLRRMPNGEAQPIKELWLGLEEGVDRSLVIGSLGQHLPAFSSVRDRDAVVELARRNPLAGGGWNGLIVLSTATITLVVLLALIIHAVIAVYTGRIDLAVTRALGFSRYQIFLSLAVERALVLVVGLAAGGALGYWPGREILKLLDVSAIGRPVVPPMILTVQVWLLALVLACLVGAALFGLGVAAWSAHRLKTPDILRTGG